jgi:anti-sigma-K factor RskA
MNAPLEELACLYVLDRLDLGQRVAFEASLLDDPELAALVKELESALAQRIRALPVHPPPAGLLARLEARIDRLPASPAARPGGTITVRWTSLAQWGIAALIAVSLGTLAVQHLWRGAAPGVGSLSAAAGQHLGRAEAEHPYIIVVGLNAGQSTLTEMPLQKRPVDADARFVQLASLAEQLWEKPEGLPVKLPAVGLGRRGYALFDPASSQGFIGIQQLPAAAQGKRYHLWIVDTESGEAREAGILPRTGSSSGLFFFSVAPGAAVSPDHLAFFVTAEDSAAPGSAHPSGSVVLGREPAI